MYIQKKKKKKTVSHFHTDPLFYVLTESWWKHRPKKRVYTHFPKVTADVVLVSSDVKTISI